MAEITTHRLSIEEVRGDRNWSALETDLLAECKLGRVALLPGKHELPEDASDPDRRVRPELIRYLMEGGCDSEDGARPHPSGVSITGGWIDGVLDLSDCRTHLGLSLSRCLLPHGGRCRDAHLGALFLPGCRVADALDLHRLRTEGDVHLRDMFRCSGPVDLRAARIGGQLDCSGAHFEAVAGQALDCGAAEVGASVFLRGGFEASAEVSFLGARIGGQLACNGGKFLATEGRALNFDAAEIGADVFLRDGFEALAEVDFLGAQIGGQLSCDGGKFSATEGRVLNFNAAEIGADVYLRDGFEASAVVSFVRARIEGSLQVRPLQTRAPALDGGLDLEAATIGAGLFFQSVRGKRVYVDLKEARAASLRDDWAAWDGVQVLRLDGFTYDRVDGSMSVQQRLDWLEKAVGSMGKKPEIGPSFDPQPHVQLAGVLRAQGNREGAARVLVDREKRQRAAAWTRAHDQLDGTWRAAGRSLKGDVAAFASAAFGVVFGYGHRPWRAAGWALALILLAGALNGVAFYTGQFAPNSAVIMTSPGWLQAVEASRVTDVPALELWLASDAARDYETFSWWIYGLDLVLPLDALGQEEAWRATTGSALGNLAFYSRWAFQLAGILLAAVGAAVLTGLVGRRD